MSVPTGIGIGVGVAEEVFGIDVKALAAAAINSAFNRTGDKRMRLAQIEDITAMSLVRASNVLDMTAETTDPDAKLLRVEVQNLAQAMGLILKRADLDGSSAG